MRANAKAANADSATAVTVAIDAMAMLLNSSVQNSFDESTSM